MTREPLVSTESARTSRNPIGSTGWMRDSGEARTSVRPSTRLPEFFRKVQPKEPPWNFTNVLRNARPGRVFAFNWRF